MLRLLQLPAKGEGVWGGGLPTRSTSTPAMCIVGQGDAALQNDGVRGCTSTLRGPLPQSRSHPRGCTLLSFSLISLWVWGGSYAFFYLFKSFFPSFMLYCSALCFLCQARQKILWFQRGEAIMVKTHKEPYGDVPLMALERCLEGMTSRILDG